jgi:transposase-like protein
LFRDVAQPSKSFEISRLELRVPQDHQGRFSTALFERYQRSDKVLTAALTEMYVQGVSTRKLSAYAATGRKFCLPSAAWAVRAKRRGARYWTT